MKQPLHVAGIAAGALGMLFVLIGMATPGWVTVPGGGFGLFVACGKGICASYSEIPGYLYATRALVVMGFLCSLVGVVVASSYYIRFAKNDLPNPQMTLISSVMFLVAGGLALVGAIIFAAKSKDTFLNPNFGYSFALDIVGSIFCLVAGALVMVQRSKV